METKCEGHVYMDKYGQFLKVSGGPIRDGKNRKSEWVTLENATILPLNNNISQLLEDGGLFYLDKQIIKRFRVIETKTIEIWL